MYIIKDCGSLRTVEAGGLGQQGRKKHYKGAGKLSQWLSALATLPENPVGLVTNTHMVANNHP